MIGLHLHTFVDHARKRSKNGDEEGVLDVIQITGDPSAERTAPPRSTHVQSAWCLLLLDPARGKERLMKIQQHDGVVVDAGRHRSRASSLDCERERCSRGEGGAKSQGYGCPSLPPLYRPPRGCSGPRRWDLLGGRRPRGGVPPKIGGAPPTLGFPTLGAGGRPMGGAPAH